MGSNTERPIDQRIESWKKIALHFGRDERTVKRWEKERNLPVHRMPGRNGGVFAYTSELDTWLDSSRSARIEASIRTSPTKSSLDPVANRDTGVRLERQFAPPSITKWRVLSLTCVLTALGCVAIVAFVRVSRIGYTGSLPKRGTPQSSSYPLSDDRELYLMGKFYWNQRTCSGLHHAVDYFDQAIARNPGSARAYAGLASTYDLMPEYAFMPNQEAFPKAIEAAKRAIKLDPSLPEAHRALAFGLFFWEWDVPGSIAEYQRAIALDPNEVESHHWYATELLSLGRMAESRIEIERARELDPTSRSIIADEAFIEYVAGDVTDGIRKLRALEQSEPELISVHRFLATALFETKDFPGFIEETQQIAAISNDPEEKAVAAAARDGWMAHGERSMLTEMLAVRKKAFEEKRNSGYTVALLAAQLGKRDEAISYLQAALRARDYMLMTVSNGTFESFLKGDPAFESVKLEVNSRMRGINTKMFGTD
jgi:tetratricopeptide (TPR) repeat protein